MPYRKPLTIKVNLTDEEIEWLTDNENILFHCCGTQGSTDKLNTRLQEKFETAIRSSLAQLNTED